MSAMPPAGAASTGLLVSSGKQSTTLVQVPCGGCCRCCWFLAVLPISGAQGFATSGDYEVWMVGLRGRHERRAGRALAGLYEEHGAAVFAFALVP